MLNITHNNGENSGVFTADQDHQNAGVLEYDWKDEDTFCITHTQVEPEFGESGLGHKLVDASVDYARSNNKKIVATCTFAKSILESNEAYNDVYKTI